MFAGSVKDVYTSWAFHKAHVHRWMSDFGVGGLRLDSVNNIANYDFVRSYKEHSISVYQSRPGNPPKSKFLVIGEELSCPLDLIQTGCLNALWNEPFQARIRAVILGESADYDFESTVRKMVDCNVIRIIHSGMELKQSITSHPTTLKATEKSACTTFSPATACQIWSDVLN